MRKMFCKCQYCSTDKGITWQYAGTGVVKAMSPLILLAILFAAFLHALWNIIVKSGENKLFETGLNAFGACVGALCLLPLLPPLSQAAWPYLAMSCLCHLGYYICISVAYERVDMSFAYTVMRGCAPLLTSLALLAFGVSMTAGAWCGVLTLCAGILCLGTDNMRRGYGWSEVFISLRTSCVIMGYTLADGLGARASGTAATYTIWIFLVNALPVHIYILWRHGMSYVGYARKRLVVGTFGGLASMGSYGIALWAMTLAPIAVVAALRETSVIFGMLLAMWLLGERLTPLRCVSVLLVVCGAAMLKLA